MSGIITPGQSKLVLHNRSEPYELTYNIAKSSGNKRRGIVLISESGSNQQSPFLTFPKLFMVFKILFRWGKTMSLKSRVAYKDVQSQRQSLSLGDEFKSRWVLYLENFYLCGGGDKNLPLLFNFVSDIIPGATHLFSKLKILYDFKPFLSSGNLPSSGNSTLSIRMCCTSILMPLAWQNRAPKRPKVVHCSELW